MPARIVVVHNDPEFTERTVAALVAAGHDVRAFTDTMSALKALERAQRVEVLVTRVVFPPGQPNGVSLALMAKLKRPGMKVLFAAQHETREHTEGLGEFLPAPADPVEIAAWSARCSTNCTGVAAAARERCESALPSPSAWQGTAHAYRAPVALAKAPPCR
jgi:DNA-binding NtrC family response regulator